MNIKDNASKFGNGILDISPRNVGKALISPFTYINRKKNERIQNSSNKANAALSAIMAAAITKAMEAASKPQGPTDVDFTVVEKAQNDSN